MKRTDLEKHLGKFVRVTLFDGTFFGGVLHKTGEPGLKSDPNLYLPKNLYFCAYPDTIYVNRFLFRCSHVKKLEEVTQDGTI